jgi:plasmid stabilization system protein ParE
MKIRWSAKALSHLIRLYDFLAPVNRAAAIRTMRLLTAAPTRLAVHPRLGEKLEDFEPREVRLIFVGNYEIRYEVRDTFIFIIRIWHTREHR